MKSLARIWSDETGAIVSIEIVLVATILVIGAIVGLEAVRGAVVTELADLAQAVGNVNQSYSYSGVTGHGSYTAGSVFNDRLDSCDTVGGNLGSSKCVRVITPPATSEGGGFQGPPAG